MAAAGAVLNAAAVVLTAYGNVPPERAALLGAAETQAMAAEALAIERGVATEQIAAAEGVGLHAAAFNGMPDPVLHLAARAMVVVTGLAALEPDPRAPAPTCSCGPNPGFSSGMFS